MNVTVEADYSESLEHVKINKLRNLRHNNLVTAKIEYLKEEVTAIKVSSGSEYEEQMTPKSDILMKEEYPESIKWEQGVEEDKIIPFDTELRVKTETDDMKYEIDIEEHELKYEQVKSIKTEDALHKKDFTKCYVRLDRLHFDDEQCINNVEKIKLEQSDQIGSISDGIEVAMEEQNAVDCNHITGDLAKHSDLKNIKGRKSKAAIKSKSQSYINVADKGNVNYFNCQFCEYIAKCKDDLEIHFTTTHNEKAELDECSEILEHVKINTLCNLSHNNFETVKIEDVMEEMTDIKVSPGSGYVEQMTLKSDVLMKEEYLESIKCEQGVEEDKIIPFDSGMRVKTETDDMKYEIDIEEHELKYEQVKSIKTENALHKKDFTKCYVRLDRCPLDDEQYINNVEKIKPAQSDEIGSISDGMKRQNTVNSNYKTGHEARHSKHKNIKGHKSKSEDKSLSQSYIDVANKGNVKYFNCHFCEYIAKCKNDLEIHVTKKHNEKAELYHCSNCKYTTKVKKYLVQHHRVHRKENKWHQCHLCDYKTKYKGSMALHQRSKHNDAAEINCCKMCDYETKLKHGLKSHGLKHDDAVELFCCALCNFKTKRKFKLLEHHKIKHDNAAEVFHCELCNFETKRKHHFLYHHRIKHDDTAEVFHCELCNFKTKYRASFKCHKSHHEDSPDVFHCALCDFKTKYKRNLSQHHRLKHDDAAEVFHCKVCDYKTKSKRNLLLHNRLQHENAEIFHCELCAYKTKYKHHFMAHRRSKHDNSAEIRHFTRKRNENAKFYLCRYKTKVRKNFVRHFRRRHNKEAK